ncbi:helix-turn-helix transcriptional regulator [Agrococcus sp. SGAir0287]|uniref:helix-turn-helix transcriptional regulator n=1 Tax=Agrococcus sp. SGAir0287 TaxID=2070347 RepID=UPI0010F9DBD1|nr:helix-turn-helix transcriptional regulator [Agrococcus sp. SGAir0287]
MDARTTDGEPERPLVAVFAATAAPLPRVVGIMALTYATADVLVTRSAAALDAAQPDVLVVVDHAEATDAVVERCRSRGVPIVRVVPSRAAVALEPGVVPLDGDARLTAVAAKLDAAIRAPGPRIRLSDRERAAVYAVVDGRSRAQIARDLEVEPESVTILLRGARAAVRAQGHPTGRDELAALARRGVFRREPQST